MQPRQLVALALTIELAAATSPVGRVAAQGVAPVVPGARQSLPSDSQLTISGTVVRSDGKTAVAKARLRLRSVTSGVIVGTSVSGSDGAFSFAVSGQGLYVVEVVGDDDSVIAVSSALDAAGAPMITTVVLPGTSAAFPLVGTALAVMAAAAAVGITIVVTGGEGPQNALGVQPTVLSPEQ